MQRLGEARVILESGSARVEVWPDRGARVSSLRDKRTGREWLAPGEPPCANSDAAVYGLAEAAGWDECFPTVAPCPASPRDHGDLWGRPWTVEAQAPDRLTTAFRGDGYVFRRELRLRGATLTARYRVENLTDRPRPVLWAMHPLFAARPGERLTLARTHALAPAYLSSAPDRLVPVPWPSGDGRTPQPLDRVLGPEARFAGKFFAAEPGARGAGVHGPCGALEMRWRGVRHVGLWLTYGAWPSPNAVVHVAFEPTTSPHDALAQRSFTLPALAAARWAVRLRLRDRSDNSGNWLGDLDSNQD